MLKLSLSDYDEIRRHGEETYPEECCGVLLGLTDGDTRTVRLAVRCTNTAVARSSRYEIAPRELISTQRLSRERGLEIVGFYHSHPDHPATWSHSDFEQAHWIGCSYVITQVEAGRATRTAAFALTGRTEDDKAFVEEPMVTE